MYSKEKEYVDFGGVEFEAAGPVEVWLCNLEDLMRKTLLEKLTHAKSTSDNWEVDNPRE